MLHAKLVKSVENAIERMDMGYMKRAHLLLQSDLWSASRRFDDRKNIEPDLMAELESERDRIKKAIEKR